MDIRVLTTFPNHRKTRRLIKELGFEAVYSLITLWAYVAENHPKGNLNGYDVIEVEESAKWTGENGLFVKTILEEKTCFLLKIKDGYALRNWEKHQGWIVNAPERREKARVAAAARWIAPSNAPSNATSIPEAMLKSDISNAPSPSPNPSPKPTLLIKEKDTAAEIPEELDCPEFTEAWGKWQAYRKKIKKPLKEASVEGVLKRFEKEGVSRSIEAIDLTIENGWIGLVWEKVKSEKKGKKLSLYEDNSQDQIDMLEQLAEKERIRYGGENISIHQRSSESSN